jgi:hypothetical protein
MKKRDLLLTGVAIAGGAWIYQFWRSPSSDLSSSDSSSKDQAIAVDSDIDLTKATTKATKKYQIMKTEEEIRQQIKEYKDLMIMAETTEDARYYRGKKFALEWVLEDD